MTATRILGVLGLLVPLMIATPSLPVAAGSDGVIILSYHDVRDDVAERGDPDGFAIHSQNFAAHLDWLSGNGYQPISLAQLIAAVEDGAPLPPRPVLLTIDDGLRSLWTHVFPLLRAYDYPAVAAVVTSWVDLPEGETVDYGHRMFDRDDFVTWDQLREMQDSGLIEIASHSHDLHRGVRANPQGNQTPAAITRIYEPGHGYESEAAYRERIETDLRASRDLIQSRLARPPRSIIWPYAAYSRIGNEIADRLGMRVSFDLEGPRSTLDTGLHGLSRLLIMNNPGVSDLVHELRRERELAGMRALQVDLDALYDDDPEQIERKLDVLIERVQRIGPSHVFLQAFADPDGNGSAAAVYFPNRHLPVRADLFSRVAWQLLTRAGTEVYAWMPVLAFEPNDPELRRSVPRDVGDRLDFTHAPTRRWILDLYEDLAASSYLAGLRFHDEADLGTHELPHLHPGHDHAGALALIEFTIELKHAAERWRPKLATVRNPFPQAPPDPRRDPGFGPRLDAFQRAYDYTILSASADDVGVRQRDNRINHLFTAAAERESGATGIVFQLPTVEQDRALAIAPARLAAQLRQLQALGARHLAWYPDDFVADRPPWPAARASLSARSFPYQQR